jgi:hypothetical protein
MARAKQLSKRAAKRQDVGRKRGIVASQQRLPSVLPRSRFMQQKIEQKRQSEAIKKAVNKIVEEIQAGKYRNLSQIPEQYRKYINITQGDLNSIQSYYKAKKYKDAYNSVMRHYNNGMLWAVAAYGSGLKKSIAKDLIKQGYAPSKLAMEKQYKERTDALKELFGTTTSPKGTLLNRVNKDAGVKIVGSTIVDTKTNKPISLTKALNRQAVKEINKNLPVFDKLIYDKNYNIKGINSGLLGESIPWNQRSLNSYSQRISYSPFYIPKIKPTGKQVLERAAAKKDYDFSKNLQPGEEYIYKPGSDKIIGIKSNLLNKTFDYTNEGRALYNTRILMMFHSGGDSATKKASWGDIVNISTPKDAIDSVFNIKNLLVSGTKQIPKVLMDYAKSFSRGAVKNGLYIIDNIGQARQIKWDPKTNRYEIPPNTKYITDGIKLKEWAKYDYKIDPLKDPDFQTYSITVALYLIGAYSAVAAKIIFGAVKGKAAWEVIKDPSPYNVAVLQSLFIPGLAKRGTKFIPGLRKMGIKLSNKILTSKQMKTLGIKVNNIKAIQKARAKSFRYRTTQASRIKQISSAIKKADMKKLQAKKARKFRATSRKQNIKKLGLDKYESSSKLVLKKKLGIDKILKELDKKIEIKSAKLTQRQIRKLRAKGYKINKQIEKKIFNEIHNMYKNKYRNSPTYKKLLELKSKDIETSLQVNKYKNSYLFKQGLKKLKVDINKISNKGLGKLRSIKKIQSSKIKGIRDAIKKADMKKLQAKKARKFRATSRKQNIKRMKKYQKDSVIYEKQGKYVGKEYVKVGRNKWRLKDTTPQKTIKIKSITDSSKNLKYKKMNRIIDDMFREIAKRRKIDTRSPKFNAMKNVLKKKMARAIKNKDYKTINEFKEAVFNLVKELNKKKNKFEVKGVEAVVDKNNNIIKTTKRIKTIKDFNVDSPKGKYVEVKSGDKVLLQKVKTKQISRTKNGLKTKDIIANKVFIIKQVKLPIMSISQLASLLSISALSAGSLTGTRTATKTRTGLATKTMTRTATKPKTMTRTGLATKTMTRTAILQAVKTKEKQRTDTKLKKDNANKKKGMIIFNEINKLKTKTLSKSVMTYGVMIKKSGKLTKLNLPPLSEESARDIISYNLDNRLVRTGKIIRIGKRNKIAILPQKVSGYYRKHKNKLRQYKIKNKRAKPIEGTYIEKTKYIQDTRGEKRELARARINVKRRKKVKRATKSNANKKQVRRRSVKRATKSNANKKQVRRRSVKRATKSNANKKQVRRRSVKRATRKTTKRKITPAQHRVLLARLKKARAVRMKKLKSKNDLS